jgi:ribonuclease Z
MQEKASAMKKRWFVAGFALALLAAGAAAVRFSAPVQAALASRMIDRHMGENRDRLMTDDALRVVICGSGSPLPDPNAAESCVAVIAGGRIILSDVGSGSMRNLVSWPLPIGRVGDVLLTHFHSDHIADLPIANMQSWVDGRSAPLRVWGGPGVEAVVDGYNLAFAQDSSYRSGHHGEVLMPMRLAAMEARLVASADGAPLSGLEQAVIVDDGALKITAFAVEHPPVSPAYGYRIDYRGRSVTISGDTHATASVAEAAAGSDVLIHEAIDAPMVAELAEAAQRHGRDRLAKVLDDIQTYHATPADAREAGVAAGVRLVILTHLVPPIPPALGDTLRLRGLATRDPELRVARDGMVIELPIGSSDVHVDAIRR